MCAQKKIFRRWVVMLDRCPRCGLTFARVPGQWLGSWFLNICLAQVLVLGIVLGGAIVAYPDPPLLLLGIAGAVAAVAFPVWFFPYSRTIWVAIDLAMRPLEFDEGVDPLWELGADADALARERRRDRGSRRPPRPPTGTAGGDPDPTSPPPTDLPST